MPIQHLDHVNVVTAKLEEMVAWYEAVLGLREGPRPDFPFSGAWLYAGDAPVVHLVEDDRQTRTGSEAALKLEHFAFWAKDASAFEKMLAGYGVPFERIELKGVGLIQFHVSEPDGNHLHVDFELKE